MKGQNDNPGSRETGHGISRVVVSVCVCTLNKWQLLQLKADAITEVSEYNVTEGH